MIELTPDAAARFASSESLRFRPKSKRSLLRTSSATTELFLLSFLGIHGH